MSFKDVKKNEPEKVADPVEDILKDTADKVLKVEEAKPVVEQVSKEYVVIAELLNVRSTPNGVILEQVKSGDIIKGTPENPNWIKLSNGKGYVMSKFVAPKKG